MRYRFQQFEQQPDKVANPAYGQLNRENEFSLSPFTLEKLVSQDMFGSLPASACSFSTPSLNRSTTGVLRTPLARRVSIQ